MHGKSVERVTAKLTVVILVAPVEPVVCLFVGKESFRPRHWYYYYQVYVLLLLYYMVNCWVGIVASDSDGKTKDLSDVALFDHVSSSIQLCGRHGVGVDDMGRLYG